MPFARVDLIKGKSADYRAKLADIVYELSVFLRLRMATASLLSMSTRQRISSMIGTSLTWIGRLTSS